MDKGSRMKFTFDDYRAALRTASDHFDRITSARAFLAEPDPAAGSVLFLRHDCERDLRKAHRMAALERELGITSSYFIRVHSEYYNPLQPDQRALIRAIEEMGHEIGLHYEPKFYESDGLDLIAGLDADRAVLEGILGPGAVKTLSAHQPLLAPPDFAAIAARGLTEVYIHRDLKALRYYSDSGMAWREKTLAEAVRTETRCQFLIHPDFWNEAERDWFVNLDAVRDQVVADLDAVAGAEKQMLRDYLARRDAQDPVFRAMIDKA